MKTLIVMRHAKSSWADPGLKDLERPLNPRGRASAKAIGEWLRFGRFEPDIALVSNSRRTAETWALMGMEAEMQFVPSLYHAAAETVLREVQAAHGGCVLVLGHNPGIGDFADRILAQQPTHDRFLDYPTGATLVAQTDRDWASFSWRQASARAFTVPRDLL